MTDQEESRPGPYHPKPAKKNTELPSEPKSALASNQNNAIARAARRVKSELAGPSADQLPPHSVEAEQGVLGCLLLSPFDCLPECDKALPNSGVFYDIRHRTIYEGILALRRQGTAIDTITLQQWLKDDKKLEAVGGLAYLASLPDAVPSAANLAYYLEIVRDKHVLRRMIGTCTEAVGRAYANQGEVDALLADFERDVGELTKEWCGGVELTGRSLAELIRHPEGHDPDEFLRHRFLCRGGGLLLVGPTGIGKSSLAMQAKVLWAIGRPIFGIEPTRPLRSLLIQAENDDGDLAEMRDGVIAGLNLTEDERLMAMANITVVREDSRTGAGFFARTVRPLLKQGHHDLLWIDPALAFIGGDASSGKDVGAFLRNLLNPILHEFGCAAVVVHHTNKPPTGMEKREWAAGDFAYLGGGSAEWANWSRAVLALRSVGSHDVFELRAAKRGARLGWKDAEGLPAYTRRIGHAKEAGAIYWREASEEETKATGRPKSCDADEVLALLPPEGLTTGDWMKAAEEECGIKASTFHRIRRVLEKEDRAFKSRVIGKWQPITKR